MGIQGNSLCRNDADEQGREKRKDAKAAEHRRVEPATGNHGSVFVFQKEFFCASLRSQPLCVCSVPFLLHGFGLSLIPKQKNMRERRKQRLRWWTIDKARTIGLFQFMIQPVFLRSLCCLLWNQFQSSGSTLPAKQLFTGSIKHFRMPNEDGLQKRDSLDRRNRWKMITWQNIWSGCIWSGCIRKCQHSLIRLTF